MISPSDMTLDGFSPLKIAFENFKSVFFFPNFKIKGIRLWGVGEQNFLHISYFLNFPAMPSKNEKTLLEESNFRISFPGTGTCLSYRYAFFGDVFPHRGLPYCDARSMSFPFLKIWIDFVAHAFRNKRDPFWEDWRAKFSAHFVFFRFSRNASYNEKSLLLESDFLFRSLARACFCYMYSFSEGVSPYSGSPYSAMSDQWVFPKNKNKNKKINRFTLPSDHLRSALSAIGI